MTDEKKGEQRYTLSQLIGLFIQQVTQALGDDGVMIVLAARTRAGLEIQCGFNPKVVVPKIASEAGTVVAKQLTEVAREFTNRLPGVKDITGPIIVA